MKKYRNIFLVSFFLAPLTYMFAGSYDKKDKEEEECTDYASHYTGFDINLGVGYSAFTFKAKIYHPAEVATDRYHFGQDGVAVQLKIGGTIGFSDYWIFGIEGYGQYNSASIKNTHVKRGVTYQADSSLEWNLGLDARIGCVYWPSNMVFLSIGPDWGYFKLHHSNSSSGVNDTRHKWLVAPRFGAGCEQKFSEHWVMRESFDYAWYQKQTHTFADGVSADAHAYLGTFLFYLGYLF